MNNEAEQPLWYDWCAYKEKVISHLKDGAIYYLWGYPHRLRIKEGNHIEIIDNEIYFYTNSKNSQREKRDALLLWYDQTLFNEIMVMKDKVEAIVGEKAHRYFIDSFTREDNCWARCSITNREITVDGNLVFFRKEVLEEMLTHEVLHLKIPTHTNYFYHKLWEYGQDRDIGCFCLEDGRPDYRYYDYLIKKASVQGYYSPEDYCDEYNIKREIF